MDNLRFPDLQALSNLQLGHENHDQEFDDVLIDISDESLDPNNNEDLNLRFGSATHAMGSPYFLDLQTKADCSTYEESNGKEEQTDSDQKFSLYFPLAEIKQSTFGIEFCEGKEEQMQHSQLDQQFKKVLLYEFDDPVTSHLDSICSINPRIFLSEGDCFYHLFKSLFCIIWSLLLFGLRFNMISVNQLLTWMHWKFDLT